MLEHRFECRHFNAMRPCQMADECRECESFEKTGPRVLLILFGRLGDVVIATALATALKQQYARSHVTWLMDANAMPLLEGHGDVERVFAFNVDSLIALQSEQFDLVVNLDRSPSACALTMQLNAVSKVGFGYSSTGAIIPLNEETEVLFDINRSPAMRATNRKSWVELYHAITGLEQHSTKPLPMPKLFLHTEEEAAAASWRSRFVSNNEKLILCNIGTHVNDPQKRWPMPRWQQLWRNLSELSGMQTVVHAGPHEEDLYAQALDIRFDRVHTPHFVSSLREAMWRIYSADAIITADSLVLHLAIALKRPVIGLFGPTNPSFVQRAANVVLLRGYDACQPCHARRCCHQTVSNDVPCLDEISPETVLKTLVALLGAGMKSDDNEL